MKTELPPEYLHTAFRAGLVFKGAFAAVEIVAGIAAWFVTQRFALAFANAMTRTELSEDPHDIVANYLMHSAEHWTASRQHFFALYLLSHGIVKLWLIAGLWLRRLWYYPAAIIVFSIFVVYQVYRFALTHSPLLLILTSIDILVIGLTRFEYSSLHGGFRQT